MGVVGDVDQHLAAELVLANPGVKDRYDRLELHALAARERTLPEASLLPSLARLSDDCGLGRSRHDAADARVALVGGVDEELRLLDQLVRALGAGRGDPVLVGAEQVVRELCPDRGR